MQTNMWKTNVRVKKKIVNSEVTTIVQTVHMIGFCS